MRLWLAASVSLLSGVSVVAQQRLAPVVKAHEPYLALGIVAPLFADFDGDGTVDVLERGALFPNTGGHFAPVPTRFANLNVGLGTFDFDGDGRPDVLHGSDTSYPNAQSLAVGLNRFPGAFVAGTLPALPSSSINAWSVADFDSDGDFDIALFLYSSGTLPILLANDGFGNFTDVSAATMPAQHVNAEDAIAADLDADGDVDLLLTGAPSLAWLENQGGAFAAPSSARFPPGYGYAFAVADLDGDGDQDIIANDFDVLVQTPTGFVLAAQVFPQLSRTFVAAVGDIDGDQDLDVWIDGYDRFGWFENVGGLVFVDRRPVVPQYRFVRGSTIVDIDGDGRQDVIAGRNRIAVLFGQPGGEFVDVTPADPIGEIYGDFDGDGLIDHLQSTSQPFQRMVLRKNLGAGRYAESTAHFGLISQLLAACDIDGDGDLDLAAGSVGGRLRTYRNDGTGSFTIMPPASVSLYQPEWVHFVDLDGDVDLDLIVHCHTNNIVGELHVLQNDGTGVFQVVPAWTIPSLQGPHLQGAVFDADGDGDLDLVAGAQDPRLFRNDGTGRLVESVGALPPQYAVLGQAPGRLLAGDLDRDGDQDLLSVFLQSSSPNQADAVYYQNNGAGAFTVATVLQEPSYWNKAELFDANGDDAPDLFVSLNPATGLGRMELRENDGAGGFPAAAASLVSSQWYYGSVTIHDLDHDGDLDVIASGQHVFYNLTRHLRVPAQPRLGGVFTVECPNPEPTQSRSVAFLIGTTQLAAPVSLGGVGPIFVDPAAAVTLLQIGSGTLGLNLALPANPAFAGLDLITQAAMLESSSFALTNAVRERILY
jgi:hypothetical protein